MNWRNPFRCRSKVLLLCGKAGVGKTSLVARLVGTDFFSGQAHAIFLRHKTDCFDSAEPWESVKCGFGCMDDECYRDVVLILDGFDELCVLKSSFKGHAFLTELPDAIPKGQNIKILITSREYNGYFEQVDTQKGRILVEHILWDEEQLFEWCDKYAEIRGDGTVSEWNRHFQEAYSGLKANDPLKEIFCVPIIAYMCCHENIDIASGKSLVKIYDEAFKKVVKRAHARMLRSKELKQFDEQSEEILWQLTKEIAYQMVLHNTLESAAGTDMIRAAKARVMAIIPYPDQEKYDTFLTASLEQLPAVFHFSAGTQNGIEFAHKTVAEYFTAVKLYEDYLKEFNTDFFEKTASDEALETVWSHFIEAFRYCKLPEDIFSYLGEMIILRGKENKLAYPELERRFIEGMDQEILAVLPVGGPVREYIVHRVPVSIQISYAFRNLTWLLASCGFCNTAEMDFQDKTKIGEQLRLLTNLQCSDLNLQNWNLKGVVMTYTNLQNAQLYNTILNGAVLIGVNLSGAKMQEAEMQEAKMQGAKLTSADMRDAILNDADLSSADLAGAILIGTNLTGADLTATDLSEALSNIDTIWEKAIYSTSSFDRTIFPDDLDPRELGMIKVDYFDFLFKDDDPEEDDS